MANIIQNMAGMGNLTEQIIASDFLTASKAGIKMYAYALTEAATPNVRDILHKHLDVAIQTHEKITNYMISKRYYHPYDPQKQINADLQAIDNVMNID